MMPFALAAVAATTLALAPSAQARERDCPTESERGRITIIDRSKDGSVFQVFRRNRVPLYKGCLFSQRRWHRLPGQCCQPERFRLSGRFVLWIVRGSAIGDEDDSLGVFDLRRGRRKDIADGPPKDHDTASFVRDYVLKKNGSIAWIESASGDLQPPQPGYELYTVAHEEGPGPRLIDSGNIEPESLRLSRDRERISWVKDGVRRSAPLR